MKVVDDRPHICLDLRHADPYTADRGRLAIDGIRHGSVDTGRDIVASDRHRDEPDGPSVGCDEGICRLNLALTWRHDPDVGARLSTSRQMARSSWQGWLSHRLD